MGYRPTLETGAKPSPDAVGRTHSNRAKPVKERLSDGHHRIGSERYRGAEQYPEMACGATKLIPLSRFPQEQAGAGGFPPRRKHDARQQTTLARIEAAGSPHKRGQ